LDANYNGVLDLDRAEPLGWYTTQPSGPFVPIFVKENGITANLTISLMSSNHFDYQFTNKIGKCKQDFAKKKSHFEISAHELSLNGTLKNVKGFNVMHLRGDPVSRGYAHGALAGKQILDWFRYLTSNTLYMLIMFRFYLLEQTVKSASFYESNFVPFLRQNFTMDPDFKLEAEAIIKGMRDSGINLYIVSISYIYL